MGAGLSLHQCNWYSQHFLKRAFIAVRVKSMLSEEVKRNNKIEAQCVLLIRLPYSRHHQGYFKLLQISYCQEIFYKEHSEHPSMCFSLSFRENSYFQLNTQTTCRNLIFYRRLINSRAQMQQWIFYQHIHMWTIL